MPHRALIKHRPWLLASLVAGVSYFFVADDPIGGAWLMLWKGAGVGFLALYAAFRTRGFDGLLIAGALTLGALGDVTLEISFLIGGALFAVFGSYSPTIILSAAASVTGAIVLLTMEPTTRLLIPTWEDLLPSEAQAETLSAVPAAN